jgi:hypothetical protein
VERVFSDEAAEHIRVLLGHHWTQTQIAKAAGVAPSTVSQAKVRGTTINEETAERIMSVQPGQARP